MASVEGRGEQGGGSEREAEGPRSDQVATELAVQAGGYGRRGRSRHRAVKKEVVDNVLREQRHASDDLSSRALSPRGHL